MDTESSSHFMQDTELEGKERCCEVGRPLWTCVRPYQRRPYPGSYTTPIIEAQHISGRIVTANQSSWPQDTREIILGKTRMRWLSSCAQVPWVPSSPPRCPQSQIFVPHPHSGLASDYYFFFFHKRKVASTAWSRSTSTKPPVCAPTLLWIMHVCVLLVRGLPLNQVLGRERESPIHDRTWEETKETRWQRFCATMAVPSLCVYTGGEAFCHRKPQVYSLVEVIAAKCKRVDTWLALEKQWEQTRVFSSGTVKRGAEFEFIADQTNQPHSANQDVSLLKQQHRRWKPHQNVT